MGTAKMPDVVNGYKWELYNLTEDYSQNNDLAAKNARQAARDAGAVPGRGGEIQRVPARQFDPASALLDAAAERNRRPERSSPTRARCPVCRPATRPASSTKSYTITAEVEVPQGGGEGMIVTLGGRFGGYGFYLLKGKPVFLYNLLDLERFRWEGQDALTPGKHTIVFDFTYDGPGPARAARAC